MLFFGAVAFAMVLATRLPHIAQAEDAQTWSGAVGVAAAIVMIWLTWWTMRELAGKAVGKGRFLKWFIFNTAMGVAHSLPYLVSEAMAAVNGAPSVLDWRVAIANCSISLLLMMPSVRVFAIAISGDRIKLPDVRRALYARQAEILSILAIAVAIYWVGLYAEQSIGLFETLGVVFSIVISIAIQTLGTCLSMAIILSAYLEVDRSVDKDRVGNIFA